MSGDELCLIIRVLLPGLPCDQGLFIVTVLTML